MKTKASSLCLVGVLFAMARIINLFTEFPIMECFFCLVYKKMFWVHIFGLIIVNSTYTILRVLIEGKIYLAYLMWVNTGQSSLLFFGTIVFSLLESWTIPIFLYPIISRTKFARIISDGTHGLIERKRNTK